MSGYKVEKNSQMYLVWSGYIYEQCLIFKNVVWSGKFEHYYHHINHHYNSSDQDTYIWIMSDIQKCSLVWKVWNFRPHPSTRKHPLFSSLGKPPYLILVHFFTLTHFEAWKFYTQTRKWPPPLLELFRKLIRFGEGSLPLLWWASSS